MANARRITVLALLAVVSLVAFTLVLDRARLGVRAKRVEAGPASPVVVPSPPVAHNVYLAPFGEFPVADAEALVVHYRQKFDLKIEVLSSIPLPEGAFDTGRDQVIAERLIDAIGATDVVAADPDAVVIALTDVDMYIAAQTWRYAYGLRSEGNLAVVSTARMDELGADEARQMQRLRKMVTKDIGILYFGLALSDDPRSVLYRDIGGPRDLDYVSEDF